MNMLSPHTRSIGQGPTVVLLHSSGSSGRQWDPLMQALQSRYRVHAIDLHGHGGTAAWNSVHRMKLADEASLVEPLLRDAASAHLIGHSYGGALALKLAALHPSRIASIAVFEPVMFRLLFDDSASALAAEQVMIAARSITSWNDLGQPDRAAQHFVDFWSGQGAWARMPDARQRVIAARIPSIIGHFHALFTDDYSRRDLTRLAVPALCLTGTQTTEATRRIGELLRCWMPEATHELMSGMGHMGPITHAARVTERIVKFLDDRAERANDCEPLRQAA